MNEWKRTAPEEKKRKKSLDTGDGLWHRGGNNRERAKKLEAKRIRKLEVKARKREFGRKLTGDEMLEEKLSALEMAGIKVNREAYDADQAREQS